MVKWDNGSGLHIVYREDKCKKLDSVKITCYGKTEIWDSRKEATEFYLTALLSTEGSECQRYTKIYTELLLGLAECLARTLSEVQLQKLVLESINKVLGGKERSIRVLFLCCTN